MGVGAVRLITLVERQSSYTKQRRVADGKTCTARYRHHRSPHPLRCCVQTITDNKRIELAGHAQIDCSLEIKVVYTLTRSHKKARRSGLLPSMPGEGRGNAGASRRITNLQRLTRYAVSSCCND